MKLCRKCGLEKPATAFSKHGSTKDRLQSWCRECKNARRREARRDKVGFYATERERYREQHRKSCRRLYYRYKDAVLLHYGGEHPKCKCGFSDPRALSIDHVHGGGTQHRRELKGVNLCKWIVKNDFPPNFQILCMNCQFIKRYEENEYSRP